jgi:phage replication O-like protein O
MSRALIPNSTQIPDVILDHWMAELSGAEFKVLLYIARRTYGFGKDSDSISLNQIAQGITKRDGTTLDRGTGVSRSSVARVLNTLEERGIIIRKANLSETGTEFEGNSYSINLNWTPAGGGGRGEGPGGKTPEPDGGHGPGRVVLKSDYPVSKSDYPPSKPCEGVVPKSDYLVSKQDGGWSENRTTVVLKSDPQETDLQETEQETAAAPAAAAGGADAAAGFSALVKELTSHGVSRVVAEGLARGKPEECRKYLGYLPHAKIKTTKGAWLANAIRDGYGPPDGMERAKNATAPGNHGPSGPRISPVIDLQRKKRASLGATYSRLEKTNPEAFSAFLAYVQEEKVRVSRVADALSPSRRAQCLAAFDEEETRLDLLDRWLATAGESERLVRPGHLG